jgi:hypothetical protein
MVMRRIALGLKDETYEKIDAARGNIPRERFIRDLITTALDDSMKAAHEAAVQDHVIKDPPPKKRSVIDTELMPGQAPLVPRDPTPLPRLNATDDHSHVWIGGLGNTHCKVCGTSFQAI